MRAQPLALRSLLIIFFFSFVFACASAQRCGAAPARRLLVRPTFDSRQRVGVRVRSASGAVYHAKEKKSGRDVAIKKLPASWPPPAAASAARLAPAATLTLPHHSLVRARSLCVVFDAPARPPAAASYRWCVPTSSKSVSARSRS